MCDEADVPAGEAVSECPMDAQPMELRGAEESEGAQPDGGSWNDKESVPRSLCVPLTQVSPYHSGVHAACDRVLTIDYIMVDMLAGQDCQGTVFQGAHVCR